MKQDLKRQNFNVTPEQEADIAWLKDAVDAPSAKDALLYAVRVMNALVREVREGKAVYLVNQQGERERLLIPEIPTSASQWTYLAERAHPWRRQLYVKGRRLPAWIVWMDMLRENETREEAAYNWDLPLAAVDEIIAYCEQNKELLDMEADEEKRLLKAAGVDLGD